MPEDQPDLNDESCPTRPYRGLYEYEVAEVFFLNDEDEYLEVEINPTGLYYILTFNGYRNETLDNLPLFPNGVYWHNNCTMMENGCRWNSTAIIPKDYMPAKVTKFNAYAIHHNCKLEPIYEAYSPIDPTKDNVTEPDFHYFGAFEPIDLATIGFVQEEMSDLWDMTTDDEAADYMFNYTLVWESDCESTAIGVDYSCNIGTVKRTRYENFIISFQVEEAVGVVYDLPPNVSTAGPNGLLDETSESFWLTYTSSSGEMLRIGVNPAQAYRVSLIAANETIVSDAIELESVFCAEGAGDKCNFQCDITVPWSLLPANVTNFQMMNAHYPFNVNNNQSFVSALCPGYSNETNTDPFDWVGCMTDTRTVAERREQHSWVWLQALGMTTTTTTTTTKSTTKSTTPSTTSSADKNVALASAFLLALCTRLI